MGAENENEPEIKPDAVEPEVEQADELVDVLEYSKTDAGREFEEADSLILDHRKVEAWKVPKQWVDNADTRAVVTWAKREREREQAAIEKRAADLELREAMLAKREGAAARAARLVVEEPEAKPGMSTTEAAKVLAAARAQKVDAAKQYVQVLDEEAQLAATRQAEIKMKQLWRETEEEARASGLSPDLVRKRTQALMSDAAAQYKAQSGGRDLEFDSVEAAAQFHQVSRDRAIAMVQREARAQKADADRRAMRGEVSAARAPAGRVEPPDYYKDPEAARRFILETMPKE